MKEEKMLLKLTDLARMSGIPYITLYREVQDKNLKPIKIRNAIYILKKDWDKYLCEKYLEATNFDANKMMAAIDKMDNEQLLKASNMINTDIMNIFQNVNNLQTGKKLNKITSMNTDEFLKEFNIK